ncbi:hypothetical protein BO221_32470 [Archangium sp. Cb G35]|uniref:hypothetical protein n=1 Tax=Archangium sp. Cb G35 TaxID=1920190 RepID=UPI000935E4BA|nr:hypothetical protein [Archangium sp. Cb G35]OJT19922.1 hypothetical protein BO221_32470 [Archangium sp. Cb G35]
MTLIELIVILWPIGAILTGLVLGFSHGVHEGLVASSLCLGVPYVLFKGLSWVLSRWKPDWPSCRKGACGQRDYEVRVDARDPEKFIYVCGCGDTYKRLPSEPSGSERFVQVDEEGRSIPYLFHRPWRAWEPEP